MSYHQQQTFQHQHQPLQATLSTLQAHPTLGAYTAFASTGANHVAKNFADTLTPATNATSRDIHPSNATTPQQHCSDPKLSNPLPKQIITPVNITTLTTALLHHPDQETVAYILNGLTHGFDIGSWRSNLLTTKKTEISPRKCRWCYKSNTEGASQQTHSRPIRGTTLG